LIFFCSTSTVIIQTQKVLI